MTTGFFAPVIRPPPPSYSAALSYPSDTVSTTNPEIKWPSDCAIPVTEDYLTSTDSIYQTLPGEKAYVYHPGHVYKNIGPEKVEKIKCRYSFRKSPCGKPLIILEAIPETLASSKEEMGVKTYAQLEVHPNGKAVLVPINGTINPDKMIVDALLSDYVKNETCTCEFRNGDAKAARDDSRERDVVGVSQVDRDMRNLTHSLDEEEKCSALGENAPLLQNENAQSNIANDNVEYFDDINRKTPDDCEREHYKDRDEAAVDNVRVELSDFSEHLTDRNTDHVVDQIIYSEPEYSSSDVSIKCTGETPKHNKDKCQKTLKRTHNGVDHTVYELSPSDSFYSSADNVQAAGKGPSSIASTEGLSRLGQSSSSLTDTQRTRHPLNRETSVSFKKPLVSEPSDCCTINRATADPPGEPVVVTADAEPLVNASTNRSESSETIPSNLILDDTRTYYNRKAADRGTLYCACVGISIVATIVFLLIYFS